MEKQVTSEPLMFIETSNINVQNLSNQTSFDSRNKGYIGIELTTNDLKYILPKLKSLLDLDFKIYTNIALTGKESIEGKVVNVTNDLVSIDDKEYKVFDLKKINMIKIKL